MDDLFHAVRDGLFLIRTDTVGCILIYFISLWDGLSYFCLVITRYCILFGTVTQGIMNSFGITFLHSELQGYFHQMVWNFNFVRNQHFSWVFSKFKCLEPFFSYLLHVLSVTLLTASSWIKWIYNVPLSVLCCWELIIVVVVLFLSVSFFLYP